MSKKDSSELEGAKQRKSQLETVLNWKIVPQIDIVARYRVTIAYGTDLVNSKNIRVLGTFKGNEIPTKILECFDEFLQNVTSFGLLIESSAINDVKNWDITFSDFK